MVGARIHVRLACTALALTATSQSEPRTTVPTSRMQLIDPMQLATRQPTHEPTPAPSFFTPVPSHVPSYLPSRNLVNVYDCKGILGGYARLDQCGNCDGQDDCIGCDGIAHSRKEVDACGVHDPPLRLPSVCCVV